jgi:single-strand DNA-binding protein
LFFNRVILIGRLTKEPELRFTASGKAVANFTLAVDRPFLNGQGTRETDFIRIVVWGKQGETCANYLGKGRLVAVEGRLQVRNYQTPEGQNRTATEVIGETVRFLDRKGEAGGQGMSGPGPSAGSSNQAGPGPGQEPEIGYPESDLAADFGSDEPPF